MSDQPRTVIRTKDFGEVAQQLRARFGDAEPLAIVLVANGVAEESRALKTAASLRERGWTCLLVGIAPDRFELGRLDDLALLLVPQRLKLLTGGEAEAWLAWVRYIGTNLQRVLAGLPVSLIYSHATWALQPAFMLTQSLRVEGRSVFWVHDVLEDCHGDGGAQPPGGIEAARRIERLHLKAPDHLVTVDGHLAAILTERHAYTRRISVAYDCPLTGHGKRPATVRERLGLDGAVPLGVHAGRAATVRGLDILPALLAGLPDLHVAVVSDQEQTCLAELSDGAERAGVAARLHLLPRVAHDEVSACLADADFGLSLPTERGGARRAPPAEVIDYLHAGLPVMASDLPPQAEFVRRHDIGMVVPPNDAGALIGAVAAVLRDRGARHGRPELAALRRSYSWEEQIRPVLDVIAARDPLLYDAPLAGPRIFVGPGSNAGQPAALARALRGLGRHATGVSVAPDNRYGYRADVNLPAAGLPGMAALSRWVLEHFDVLHYHARPCHYAFHRHAVHAPFALDLLAAKAAGKAVIFSFRGGEARQHDAFLRLSPHAWSKAEDYASFVTDDEKRTLVRCVSEIADIVTVPDPELGSYVPEARILPRLIDCAAWPYVGPIRARRPLVVHAPSRPVVKGTEAVLQAVERLRAEGVEFEFRLVQGMRHDEARGVYEAADVVIDQLRIGWYGVLAVEAMALGKAVIAYIRDDLRDALPRPHPLLIAGPSDLADVLREAVLDATLRRTLGERARAYCIAEHEQGRVAAIARGYYLEALRSPSRRLAVTYAAVAFRSGRMFSSLDARVKGLEAEVAKLQQTIAGAGAAPSAPPVTAAAPPPPR